MPERQIAKLFLNGASQAVRIPKNFMFDCSEVYIRKEVDTGDVILSKKPGTWVDFFELVERLDIPCDFMDERDNATSSERDVF